MTVECTNPKEPSDVMVLRTAINVVVNDKLELSNSPEGTISAICCCSTLSLKEYKDSIEQLDSLRKRFKLDQGDIDVFKTVRTCTCTCTCIII